METKTLPENHTPPPPPTSAIDYSANVDSSRAFRSVKEAVEMFGERFLTGQIFLPSPKPPFTLPKQETPSWKSTESSQTSWKSCSPPRETVEPPMLLVNSLKKLETELEETKKELKLLKERESETKVILASLNAELHKNMLKIAKAEEDEKVAAPVVNGGGERWKMVDKKVVKKKPIIPLLGDLFAKRNRNKLNVSDPNQVYASSKMHWM
ncbi:hypothetical protein QVD17_06192 [Tagetes erecta]|uniref:WEB family protein n=1 Tax=Tagetes erecta TaxID=13708 RepID=A0AAD8LL82_TARER|nr:hypothetical protein QVD17_06192 [Tagetes erecta]